MLADMGCSFQPPHATGFERPALSHMIELDFFSLWALRFNWVWLLAPESWTVQLISAPSRCVWRHNSVCLLVEGVWSGSVVVPPLGGAVYSRCDLLEDQRGLWSCFLTLHNSCMLLYHKRTSVQTTAAESGGARAGKWSSNRKEKREGGKYWALSSWDMFIYWFYIRGRVVKAFSYDPDLYSICKTMISQPDHNKGTVKSHCTVCFVKMLGEHFIFDLVEFNCSRYNKKKVCPNIIN